jgi:hypothetical protein
VEAGGAGAVTGNRDAATDETEVEFEISDSHKTSFCARFRSERSKTAGHPESLP